MANTVNRADYKVPSHIIDTVELEFDLDRDETIVVNKMRVRPNPESRDKSYKLFLNGEDIALQAIRINGVDAAGKTESVEGGIIVSDVSEECTIEVVNKFSPKANTALSGIYASGENIMSQCEATGFRRITFFTDRPDVLSRYKVVIRGSKDDFPVMLSNGNKLEEGDLSDGRHMVVWEDPFPKPCYLFALVAGKLSALTEQFTLKDGRSVSLQIWVEPSDLDKAQHALDSLKKAIRWDEERWGLELDLNDFKIVATHDFNFGAMENKGLNIFNAKYVLASPDTATDRDYLNIESVIGHEYFHNWTGDRVTLRDWFQLTLKEGLTVFRDQEFSSDMLGEKSARAVQRIDDVLALRSSQFAEDASPMAHPIRPESYQEINNFYTSTVYNKGAEVIRMLETLLGRDKFKSGFSRYISVNDGKAVTCDEWLAAFEGLSEDVDLKHFSKWYSTAGTPRVQIRTSFDKENSSFRVTATQTLPGTASTHASPLLIPLRTSLLDSEGRELQMTLKGEERSGETERVLQLSDYSCEWVFTGINEEPVVSTNRGFSAPIILDAGYTKKQLAFLAQNDTDPFNRWDAMNELMLRELHDANRAVLLGSPISVDPLFLETFKSILMNDELDCGYKAQVLDLPSEAIISERAVLIDPEAVHKARIGVKQAIAGEFISEMRDLIGSLATPGEYKPVPADAGRRALKNVLLSYANSTGDAPAAIAAKDQFACANCLTDKLAALQILMNTSLPSKNDLAVEALGSWRSNPLLLNKWFTILATVPSHPGEVSGVERVRQLMAMDGFSLKNPNNIYALILAFFTNNPVEFHRKDGKGYKFWIEMVLEINKINPQVAARVARTLENWRRYSPELSKMMFDALSFVHSKGDELKPNVFEVVDKALQNRF